MTRVALGALRIGATVATKIRMAPEPLLRFGNNIGKRRAHIIQKVEPKLRMQHIPPRLSTLMIGEVLLSSYHQYWWYEMNQPSTPPARKSYRGDTGHHRSGGRGVTTDHFRRRLSGHPNRELQYLKWHTRLLPVQRVEPIIFLLAVNCRFPSSLPVGPIPYNQHGQRRTATI